jgi:hypothetical protein
MQRGELAERRKGVHRALETVVGHADAREAAAAVTRKLRSRTPVCGCRLWVPLQQCVAATVRTARLADALHHLHRAML